MKILPIIIFISLSIFGMILFLLQNMQIEGVDDVEILRDDNLYAGEGEICSSPYAKLQCEEGFTCATRDMRTDFEPTKETAICIDSNLFE